MVAFFPLIRKILFLVLLQLIISTGILAVTVQVNNGTHLEQLLCSQESQQLHNTTLILQHDIVYKIQPGDFCLVQQVTNLTIRGSKSDRLTKVECIYDYSLQIFSRGFGFLSTQNLSIENVLFEGCGGVISIEALYKVNTTQSVFYFKPYDKAVLLMNSCSNCQFRNITITQCFGYGIVGISNAEAIVLDRVIVENNNLYNCTTTHSTTTTIPVCSDLYTSDHDVVSGVLFLITATFNPEPTNLNITNSLFSRNKALPTANISTSVCIDGIYSELSKEGSLTQTALPSAGGLTLIFERSVDNNLVSVHISNTTFYKNHGVCFGAVLVLYMDDPEHEIVNINNCTFQDNFPLLRFDLLFDDLFGSAVTAYIRHRDTSRPSKILSITESNFFTNPYQLFFTTTPHISVVQFSASTVKSMVYFNHLFSNTTQGFLYAKVLGTNDVDIYMQDIIVRNNLSRMLSDFLMPDSAIFTFRNVPNVILNGSNHEMCMFEGNIGPVFHVSTSEFHLTGNIKFVNNQASQGSNGAAISLMSDSHLWLMEPLNIIFENNSAVYGGAIYSYAQQMEGQSCVFQYETQQPYSLENISSININMSFIHNSASLGGNSIYGDYLYYCAILDTPFIMFTSQQIPMVYDTVFHFGSPVLNGYEEVSSTPKGICICTIDQQNNSTNISMCGSQDIDNAMNITTHPGEVFSILLVPVDDIESPVYSPIVASITSSSQLFLASEQTITQTGPNCTDVTYIVNAYDSFDSDRKQGVLILNPLSTSQGSFRINIQVLQCPPGLQLSDQGYCVCINLLYENGIECSIISGDSVVFPPSNSWVGIVEQNGTDGDATIGLTKHCTTRYCQRSEVYRISDPGAFCQGNREGVLCGSCREGYSVVVGDPDCRKCSNFYLFTLLFYVLAGILCIIFLFVLRLTVSTGTIHGLIFYANLFQINTYVFLGQDYVQFLVIFISFLNFNLGFPLCLYNGMTTLFKRYLEYVFVLYLWGLAITLIIWSKYSSRLSKLISHSAVPVLGTLFQLTYSKLLYVVVSVLAFSSLDLENPDGSRETKTVWYYDGEVGYLEGGHAVLFVLVLIILFLFLIPYTVVLTGVKIFTRYRIVNRFLPLIDAYTSSYKDKYRFWYGLRLWVLIIVYISFAILREYPQAVLLIQALVLVLFLCAQSSVMPFKSIFINILDLFFVVNATALSIFGIYFTLLDQLAIVSAILMIPVLLVFCGIIFYHAWQVLGCRCKLTNPLSRRRISNDTYELEKHGEEEQLSDNSYDSTRLRVSYIEDHAEVCK